MTDNTTRTITHDEDAVKDKPDMEELCQQMTDVSMNDSSAHENVVQDEPMTKVVINRRFGGFGLSDRAMEELCRLGDTSDDDSFVNRRSPLLVQVVENLGSEAASGKYAKLKVVQIPTKLVPFFYISEYDGMERVDYDWKNVFVDFLNRLTPDNVNVMKQYGQQLLQE